ncbi:hypothetical protein, partial [Spongiibacter marinus]|uniref:hypothetical protein n=1 Tax=Spongiibacter marinus TaxID=354246 RepID=UPI003C33C8B6
EKVFKPLQKHLETTLANLSNTTFQTPERPVSVSEVAHYRDPNPRVNTPQQTNYKKMTIDQNSSN